MKIGYIDHRHGNARAALLLAAHSHMLLEKQMETEMTEPTVTNTIPESEQSKNITLILETEYPEGQRLSNYQLDQVKKQCRDYINEVVKLGSMPDYRLHFDKKTNDFFHKKYLKIYVAVEKDGVKNKMGLIAFIDNLLQLLRHYPPLKVNHS